MKVLLFDLDGTLTESGTGIIRSVRYALEKYGITESNEEKLRRFVGPPLVDSFCKYYGFEREQAREAVEVYRERFSKIGIFENELYPGVSDMLETLKKAGFTLVIASSKPEHFVVQILEHFEIGQFFDEVVGSTMDERRTSKDEVIEEALSRIGHAEQKHEVLMIGDTEHDIIGAKAHGMECVAVTYGYGDIEKMKAERPLQLVDTVKELESFLLDLKEAESC